MVATLPQPSAPNFLSKSTPSTKQPLRLFQTIPKLTTHDYESGPCRVLAASRCTVKCMPYWYRSAVGDNHSRFYMLAWTARYFNRDFHIVLKTVCRPDYHENILKRLHLSGAKATKCTIFGRFFKLRIFKNLLARQSNYKTRILHRSGKNGLSDMHKTPMYTSEFQPSVCQVCACAK